MYFRAEITRPVDSLLTEKERTPLRNRVATAIFLRYIVKNAQRILTTNPALSRYCHLSNDFYTGVCNVFGQDASYLQTLVNAFDPTTYSTTRRGASALVNRMVAIRTDIDEFRQVDSTLKQAKLPLIGEVKEIRKFANRNSCIADECIDNLARSVGVSLEPVTATNPFALDLEEAINSK